jgi:hypothetical protein
MFTAFPEKAEVPVSTWRAVPPARVLPVATFTPTPFVVPLNVWSPVIVLASDTSVLPLPGLSTAWRLPVKFSVGCVATFTPLFWI